MHYLSFNFLPIESLKSRKFLMKLTFSSGPSQSRPAIYIIYIHICIGIIISWSYLTTSFSRSLSCFLQIKTLERYSSVPDPDTILTDFLLWCLIKWFIDSRYVGDGHYKGVKWKKYLTQYQHNNDIIIKIINVIIGFRIR